MLLCRKLTKTHTHDYQCNLSRQCVCVCVQLIKKGQSFSKPDVSLMAVYITFTNKSIVSSS